MDLLDISKEVQRRRRGMALARILPGDFEIIGRHFRKCACQKKVDAAAKSKVEGAAAYKPLQYSQGSRSSGVLPILNA